MLAPLYHPVLLAEELATLDIVSGGRLVVGLGAGYMPEEFEALRDPVRGAGPAVRGVHRAARGALDAGHGHLRGPVLAAAATLPSHLRPVQEPRPPLWIGAMRRARACGGPRGSATAG